MQRKCALTWKNAFIVTHQFALFRHKSRTESARRPLLTTATLDNADSGHPLGRHLNREPQPFSLGKVSNATLRRSIPSHQRCDAVRSGFQRPTASVAATRRCPSTRRAPGRRRSCQWVPGQTGNFRSCPRCGRGPKPAVWIWSLCRHRRRVSCSAQSTR